MLGVQKSFGIHSVGKIKCQNNFVEVTIFRTVLLNKSKELESMCSYVRSAYYIILDNLISDLQRICFRRCSVLL